MRAKIRIALNRAIAPMDPLASQVMANEEARAGRVEVDKRRREALAFEVARIEAELERLDTMRRRPWHDQRRGYLQAKLGALLDI